MITNILNPPSIRGKGDCSSCCISGDDGLVMLEDPASKVLCLRNGVSFWEQHNNVSTPGLSIRDVLLHLPPRHLRGPPKNGWYDQSTIRLCLITSSSHLSGRNLPASGPYKSRFRCTANVEKATRVPLGTRMGSSPLSPPPRGKNVSSVEKRPFNGTGGNSLKAAKKM